MSAMPDQVVFHLPKKPRIKEKDAPPDQRSLAVIPLKALTDQELTDGAIRVLGVLCSYCNRAGITWVSQARLAQDLNVSRQAVTNQLMQLRKAGYVEIVKKGWRGERNNTLRVIFDKSVDTETAIAITNPIEDTRPPSMQDDTPDPEGQKRIAQAIAKALKQPTKKEYTMPQSGQTSTVKKMHEEIAKHKSKRQPIGQSPVSNEDIQQPVDNSQETVPHRQSHRQPIGHSGVSQNTENTSNSKESIGKDLLTSLNSVLGHAGVDELIAQGMTTQQIADGLDTLLPLYKAEGIEPSSTVLVAGIRQLQADVR